MAEASNPGHPGERRAASGRRRGPSSLRAIDLNLLVVLDALAVERNVTRAARRVGLTQSAMSNALRRLRRLFDDELYLRTPRGMEPTPRGLELVDGVRQTLRQAERLFATDLGFDPATSRRAFTGRMSDLVGYLALPGIAARLRERAPLMTLDVLHMAPERALQALGDHQLDFAISMGLEHASAILSDALMQDRMCCVMGPRHPLATRRLTLDRFLEARHLRVAMSPTDKRFVDDALAARDLRRNVVMTVPHWMLIPPLLQSCDLVAVVSRRFAARLAPAGILTKALPFESPPFEWMVYWHRRDDQSAAHRWLRELVREACAAA
jgi:DNA-binding transcriptional LysR family regulator